MAMAQLSSVIISFHHFLPKRKCAFMTGLKATLSGNSYPFNEMNVADDCTVRYLDNVIRRCRREDFCLPASRLIQKQCSLLDWLA